MVDNQKLTGCLISFLGKLFVGGEKNDIGALEALSPYKAQQYQLSKAERSFYKVIIRAILSGYVAFAKVRLADLIAVHPGTDKLQSFPNKITSKHVDFVICDTQYLSTKLAVEVDDDTHQKTSRIERDVFLDQALQSAQLNILHIEARKSYNPKTVERQFRSLLNQSASFNLVISFCFHFWIAL